ncbi:MAG: transcription antitermination factor NusB [Rhodospirillales bacterium]
MTNPLLPDDAAIGEFDPRLAAFQIIEDVLRRQQTLEQAETSRIPATAPVRDRAFCRLLVFACLRHLGEIDHMTRRFLKRTPTGRGRAVETVIRIGFTQLLFTDVPSYAAADTTVDLCRKARLAGFTKLVNAIMRRAIDGLDDMSSDRRTDPTINAPKWLWRSWLSTFGETACRDIADAHLREPPLDLVMADSERAVEYAESVGGAVLFDDVVRLSAEGRIEDLPGYATGVWWVQDAAATLPVRLLGDVAGLHVADLCAAPGGKTLQLASRRAIVTAVDRSRNRLQRLRENLRRTGLNATVECSDATTWEPGGEIDAILLDAPCSATGTIRRHPDIPWIRTENDVAKLTALQDRLLHHAIDILKPGGIIVYCTCSLQADEGERRIEAAIASGLPVQRQPVQPDELPADLRPAGAITRDGDLRTTPAMLADYGGMDGFFTARLRKTG